MISNTQKILLSPFFLLGLFLLLLNDFYLKSQFGNFLTGKLSDFAGLFVFPLFFTLFFPGRKFFIYLSTAVLFVVWKSPFSQSLIDFWNSFEIFRIGRIIDYTDLAALFVLPLSWVYLNSYVSKNITLNFGKRILAGFVILFSVFAFTATSYEDEKSVSYNKQYEFYLSKSELVKKLELTGSYRFREYNSSFNDIGIFYTYTLSEKFCLGSAYANLDIYEKADKVILELDFIHYWCKEQSPEHHQKLLEIFEREVIEKLRQNSSQ